MISVSGDFKSDHVDLTSISCGEDATIVAINTELELQGRLMGLGLFVGSRIRLFRGGPGKRGPLLLGIGNTRLALSRDVAKKILVEK